MKIDTLFKERCQIGKPLSQAAGKPVYLALDLQSNNSVAIKLLQFNVCQFKNWTLFELSLILKDSRYIDD
jgi:hypothetical protein